jgi:hypothetical protein
VQREGAHAQPHGERDAHSERGGHDAHAEHGEREEHGEANGEELKLTPEAVARYGVTLGEARRRALTPTLVAPARVDFDAEALAHVGSPVRGRVVPAPRAAQRRVRQGQGLLVIESPSWRGPGKSSGSARRRRRAANRAAKGAWERAKKLESQGS